MQEKFEYNGWWNLEDNNISTYYKGTLMKVHLEWMLQTCKTIYVYVLIWYVFKGVTHLIVVGKGRKQNIIHPLKNKPPKFTHFKNKFYPHLKKCNQLTYKNPPTLKNEKNIPTSKFYSDTLFEILSPHHCSFIHYIFFKSTHPYKNYKSLVQCHRPKVRNDPSV